MVSLDNMPMMAVGSTSHTAYSTNDLWLGASGGPPAGGYANQMANMRAQAALQPVAPVGKVMPVKPKEKKLASRRIVQVFIADPDENIPVNDCLLYRGDEHLTDLNDQELFFELDIKELLENHNKKRVKIVDKKFKDRTEYLEPAKIRDLKMIVVTVAEL